MSGKQGTPLQARSGLRSGGVVEGAIGGSASKPPVTSTPAPDLLKAATHFLVKTAKAPTAEIEVPVNTISEIADCSSVGFYGHFYLVAILTKLFDDRLFSRICLRWVLRNVRRRRTRTATRVRLIARRTCI